MSTIVDSVVAPALAVRVIGWGERNFIPLLRVPCVQRFLCQEGDLPAPERDIGISRLMQEHLVNAELRAAALQGAPETPSRRSSDGASGDGLEATVKPGRVYSSPPGAA